jgi:hypothetical protein
MRLATDAVDKDSLLFIYIFLLDDKWWRRAQLSVIGVGSGFLAGLFGVGACACHSTLAPSPPTPHTHETRD